MRKWKMKLWSPIDARLVLSGIQLPDGAITSDPEEIAKALGNHWTPFFGQNKHKKQPSKKNLSCFSAKV